MNERCFIGNLRLCLNCYLEDIRWQDSKSGLLCRALSQIQKSLNSTSLFMKHEERLQVVVKNCIISKDVEDVCLEDLEGFAHNLVGLLASENSFTIHSVKKIFVALFGYLQGSVSLCVYVVDLLWNAIRRCFDSEEQVKLVKNDAKLLHHTTKHGYSTFGMSLGMHLIQILDDVLNKSKIEGTSHLDGFVSCSAAHIHKTTMLLTTRFKCLINSSTERSLEVEDDMMLAVFLRFLCSFMHSVTKCDSAINLHRIISESHIMMSLVSFLDAASNHCLNNQQGSLLSHYLRHKFLMLLFRLHNWFPKWPLLASTCLQVLRSNANNLCPSLFVERTSSLSPLWLSPFAECLSLSKGHLFLKPAVLQPEKHAVFLIFKLELSMLKNQSLSDSRKGSHSNPEEQRVNWMLNWLSSKMVLPGDGSTSCFAEFTNRLASSFLQIFMDEDTLLLEMLLLLLECSESNLFSELSNHHLLQMTSKFLYEMLKPVRLLGVFLSLISYDHSVIIDFLIERGTGILCLQYLFRSMRFVRSTWPELLSLSGTRPCSTTSEGSEHLRAIDVEKLGICLVNLRDSIARLQEKHAFPYNASLLLKHLNLFEGLLLGNSS